MSSPGAAWDQVTGPGLTYQVWTGTSASGTSSPGPSAAARWRWCGCDVASSGGACCVPFPTRCWCWEASGWAKARSLADAARRARAGVRGPRLERTAGAGGGAAAWSPRGKGRHAVTRSPNTNEEASVVQWAKGTPSREKVSQNNHRSPWRGSRQSWKSCSAAWQPSAARGRRASTRLDSAWSVPVRRALSSQSAKVCSLMSKVMQV